MLANIHIIKTLLVKLGYWGMFMNNIVNIMIRLDFEWKFLWMKSNIGSRSYVSLKVLFLKEESVFFVGVLACKNPSLCWWG